MANISRRNFLVSAAVLPLVAIIPLKALAATGQIHEIEGDVFINQIKINSGPSHKIRQPSPQYFGNTPPQNRQG